MDWNRTATTTFGFSSWFTSPMDSPTTFPYATLPTIQGFPTIPMQIELPISLAVRVVLFVIGLIENSIAIFILHKSLRNGRKTFSRYALINMACSDILRALIYYPAEFVKLSQGEFVWLVHGQVGDVLCKNYAFLAQIPSKVLVLCLVALACDVTRNLSSKGRREHTRILMISFWISSSGFSSMYFVISKVELNRCIVDHADATYVVDSINTIIIITTNLILVIINLVIFCLVKRSKKEIARIREVRRVGRMKVRRQRKQFREAEGTESAKVQELTEEDQEMLSSKSRGYGGEDFNVEISQQHHTSSNPSDALIEMPTETHEGNDSCSDVDVDEEDDPSSIAQTALEEAFDMTREEAKIEGVTALLFVVLTLIFLILVFTCEVCSAYVLFVVQIVVDIYRVIKPGIYAYCDKEFRKRYKQLSPFACCCLRRIQCHAVPQQVETRSNLSYNETSL